MDSSDRARYVAMIPINRFQGINCCVKGKQPKEKNIFETPSRLSQKH
jgi:hypothetical protein